MTALSPPVAARVLYAAATARRERWIASGHGTVDVWNAALRALVGPGKAVPAGDWYRASGVLVDVAAGLPPSREVPFPRGWHRFPPEVQAAIGLPRWLEHWTCRRARPHPEAEQTREAMRIAAAYEVGRDGLAPDPVLRATFDHAARLRRDPS